MAISNTLQNDEGYIRDALESGITGEAVESTLDGVVEKANSTGTTPTQLKTTIETIVDMKKDIENKRDESYSSEYVKQNSEKIKTAINDGISSNEIATSLSETEKSANNKKGRLNLRFLTKLISKMKAKELTLRKNKETYKGRQLVKK